MGASQKQNFSGFTGIATQFQEPKGKMATVIGAVDRYVSDFGTLSAVASRYMRGREIAVDRSRAVAHPVAAQVEEGGAGPDRRRRKFHIVGEATLESRNEAGSGIVADLT